MKKEFDKSGETYQGIKKAILERKARFQKAVLNIHIPGTGGRLKAMYPTCEAILVLQKNLATEKLPELPVFFCEGVGLMPEAGYLAPALTSPYTLEAEKKATPARLWESFSGIVTFKSEGYATMGDFPAMVVGTATGAGKETQNKRLINALLALQQDNALPDEVFLAGHSRGAINCISLSNDIYIVFGIQVKVHLALTDPVPGRANGIKKRDERILPPNVVSVVIFYAQDEVKPFYTANDWTRLIVTNPKTTITSYALPGDHITALSVAYFPLHCMTHAANGLESLIGVMEKTLDVEQMVGAKKSNRKGSQFFKRTEIHPVCRGYICEAHLKIREHIEKDYSRANEPSSYSENDDFFELFHHHTTDKIRTNYLKAIYKEFGKNNEALDKTPYYILKDWNNAILKSAVMHKPKSRQKWKKIMALQADGSRKPFFITQENWIILDNIRKACNASKGNKLSLHWAEALAHLQEKKLIMAHDEAFHYASHQNIDEEIVIDEIPNKKIADYRSFG